ncbi:MAG: hypothetical protein ACJ74G_17920 [Blastocatellia bacterium]
MSSRTEASGQATLEARVSEAQRRAGMIVMAIIVSIVMYVAIALYIAGSRQSPGLTEQTRIGFYAAAAFLALGSIFFRRTQMGRTRLEVVAGLRGISGLLKHFFRVTIVSIAMADLIGLLALFAGFFGGDQNDVARFGVVAIAVALYNYPRLRSWQQAAEYFAEAVPGSDE